MVPSPVAVLWAFSGLAPSAVALSPVGVAALSFVASGAISLLCAESRLESVALSAVGASDALKSAG